VCSSRGNLGGIDVFSPQSSRSGYLTGHLVTPPSPEDADLVCTNNLQTADSIQACDHSLSWQNDQRYISFTQASGGPHMPRYSTQRVSHLLATLRLCSRPFFQIMRWRCAHFSRDVPSAGSTHEVHSTAADVHRARVSLHSKLCQPHDVLNHSKWHGWAVPGCAVYREAG